jgi:ABC1 atypical kinase-like domain
VPSAAERRATAVTDDAIQRVDTLIQVALRIARSAKNGRIVLARTADALDPSWIPRPWGDEIAAELELAREKAREPIEPKRVEQALRAAWGGKPTDELDELELEPVAITPTAQVHRGVLHGEPVAVKVLRPGIAAGVRQDLVLLEGLLPPLRSAFPAIDARRLLDEVRDRVLDELDLEAEASTQRRFHRGLRDHPFLTVPAPVTRLSHEGVMVSAWIDGVPIDRAADTDQAARRLLVFSLGSARSGVVHADLRPEDVLVEADGRVAIVDFGATRTVPPERVAASLAAVEAFAAEDGTAFAAAVAQLGWLSAAAAPAALGLARRALGEVAGPGPVRLDSGAVVAARDRLFDEPDAVVELILTGVLPPEDLWPARGVAQLFGTIARVGATADWLELIRASLRDGWEAAAG